MTGGQVSLCVMLLLSTRSLHFGRDDIRFGWDDIWKKGSYFMIEELIIKNRSTRRFEESFAVSLETLLWLVGLGRLSPSGGNVQPLKYLLSNEKALNDEIFGCLYWAGYLKDWKGPSEGERPAAYIVILNDTTISKDPGCDQGISAQSIMLGAVEKGLAGCMIGSIERKRLRGVLGLSDRYDISLVLALGKGKEKIVLEEMKAGGNIEYYRDGDDVHHVPKRGLDEIIVASREVRGS